MLTTVTVTMEYLQAKTAYRLVTTNLTLRGGGLCFFWSRICFIPWRCSLAQVSLTDPTLSVVVRRLYVNISLKRPLLLQFSSDFVQTWYVWLLGQYASELCSDKKFDPRGGGGHLRGKIRSYLKTLFILQILSDIKHPHDMLYQNCVRFGSKISFGSKFSI